MEDLDTLPRRWINFANNFILNSTYGYRLRPQDLFEAHEWLVDNVELVASRGARIIFNKQFRRIDDLPAEKPHRLLLQFLPTPDGDAAYSVNIFQLTRNQKLEFHNSPIFQPELPYLPPLDLRLGEQEANMPKPKRVTNSVKWVPGDDPEGDQKEPGLKYYDEPPEYDDQGVIQNYPGKYHDLSCFWVVEVVKWMPEAKARAMNYPSVFNTKGLVAKWPRKGHSYKILKGTNYYYGVVFGQQVMCGEEGRDQVVHTTTAAASLDNVIKTGPRAVFQRFDKGFEGKPIEAQATNTSTKTPDTHRKSARTSKPPAPTVSDASEEAGSLRAFSQTVSMPDAELSKNAPGEKSIFGPRNTGGESSKHTLPEPPALPLHNPLSSKKGKEIAHDWRTKPTPSAYDSVSQVSSKKPRWKSRSPTPQLLLPEDPIPQVEGTTVEDAMEIAGDSLRLFVRLNNEVTTLTSKHARREALGGSIEALANTQKELSIVYDEYRGKLRQLRQ